MIDILFAAVVGMLDAQPPASPAPAARHLEYRFGWNTKLADTGPLTGTMRVDSTAAPDGGITVSATESWWNAIRPTATNTCEISIGGNLACPERPYALSAMDLALFPLLGPTFFDGLDATGTSTWNRHFELDRGGSAWAGDVTSIGKGPIPNAAPLVMIESSAKMRPLGDRYREETDDLSWRIAYDPIAKLPVLASAVILHHGQNTTHNTESVQLKLLKTIAE